MSKKKKIPGKSYWVPINLFPFQCSAFTWLASITLAILLYWRIYPTLYPSSFSLETCVRVVSVVSAVECISSVLAPIFHWAFEKFPWRTCIHEKNTARESEADH